MTIGIIYARGHTLAGLRIRHHDDGSPRRWSHCGVLDGDGVWEARWPGGVRRTPRDKFDRRYSESVVVEYAVPYPVAAIDCARSLDGAPYPWLTVLGRLVRVHIDQDGPHCAEYVELVLAAGGLHRWRAAPHLVTPNSSFNNLMGVT